jgi:hypothetical protein
MTFQPPPPPPGDNPPPPPPPGSYGPPPGTGGHQAFDPKTVNNLDWGILATGLLAFIFSFTSYYSYTFKSGPFSATGHWNAWHGFFGWFAMLLALIGSVVVAMELFAPQVKMPWPNRLVGLAAYALAALSAILAIFVIPSPGGYSGPGLDKGHGFGFWISLIVILAGLVLSFMRAQQTGTALPGALGNMRIGPKGGSGAP